MFYFYHEDKMYAKFVQHDFYPLHSLKIHVMLYSKHYMTYSVTMISIVKAYKITNSYNKQKKIWYIKDSHQQTIVSQHLNLISKYIADDKMYLMKNHLQNYWMIIHLFQIFKKKVQKFKNSKNLKKSNLNVS